MELTSLGEILIDLFPAELGRKLAEVSAFRPKPGGAPANVAVAARRLGIESAFIGKVGEDAFGYHLIEVLKAEGVDTRGMRVDAQARTTLAFIAMPDEHHNEFVFYRNPGADLRLSTEDLDRELLANTRLLHCGSLSLVDEPARSAAHEALRVVHAGGGVVSFDVNYRPSLWPSKDNALEQIRALIPQVDLLKVNEIELGLLSQQAVSKRSREDLENACQALLACGPRLVVVTLGATGSFFATQAGSGFAPAFLVATVDSTGCGDAFVAGLLSRMLDRKDLLTDLDPQNLRADLRYANAVGALTALTQGVIPALPTAGQVETFLAESPAVVSHSLSQIEQTDGT